MKKTGRKKKRKTGKKKRKTGKTIARKKRKEKTRSTLCLSSFFQLPNFYASFADFMRTRACDDRDLFFHEANKLPNFVYLD